MSLQSSELEEVDGAVARHQIVFFIDGERFATTESELPVEEILALVGKAASEWYVVLHHGRDQTEYRSGQMIPMRSGAKLLTVSTGPTPVS
jgi:hypothetical protein